MGDFTQRLAELRAQREAQQQPQNDQYSSESKQRVLQQLRQKNESKKPKPSGNSNNIGNQNNQAYVNSQAQDLYKESFAPTADYSNAQPQANDGQGKNIGYMYESGLSKIGKSLAAGVGEVIGGWGDAIQMASSLGYTTGDGWDDNPLQKIGELIKDSTELDTDINFGDDELDVLQTMASGEFWLTQAPKAIPQLVDMLLIGRGAGAAVKGITKAGSKALIKEVAEEGAETLAKKFASRSGKSLSGTVKGVYEGADNVTDIGGGASRLRKIFNDRGELTNLGKTFEEIGTSVGAGFVSNVKVGLQNGTEMYNTYSTLPKLDKNGKPQYDAQGNPIMAFTNEQAAEMARNSFVNNLAYAAVDMASYGMTFGSSKVFSGLLNKATTGPAAEKVFGGMFAKAVKHLPINQVKALTKAGLEGYEESFQETWEEWAKLKGFHDATGSLEGYQGKVPKGVKLGNGDTGLVASLKSFGDFYDTFYSSDEMKGLVSLSGVLGGVMGGAGNIKQFLSSNAEEAYNAYSRTENLKRRQEQGTEGAMLQEQHIRGVINESIMQGKQDYMVDFIQNLANKGVINEEQVAYYERIYNQSAAELSRVSNIKSLDSKVAYMNQHATETQYMEEMQRAIQESKVNKEVIESSITDKRDRKKALKAEEQALLSKIDNFSAIITAAQNNKQALLSGKASSELNFETDPNTNLPKLSDRNNFFNKETNKALRGWQQNKKRLRAQALKEAFDKQQEEAMSDFQKYERTENQKQKEANKEYEEEIAPINEKREVIAKHYDDQIKEQLSGMTLDIKEQSLTQDDINKFDYDGTVSQNVAESIASKIINEKPLTEDEQRIYDAENHTIDEVIEQQYDNNPEEQVELLNKIKKNKEEDLSTYDKQLEEAANRRDEKVGSKLTEEQFNAIKEADNKVKEEPDAVESINDDLISNEEYLHEEENGELISEVNEKINNDDLSEDLSEEESRAVNTIMDLQEAAVMLESSPDIELESRYKQLIEKNPKTFEKIGKEMGLKNPLQAYRDNASAIKGLSDKQKAFVDRVVNSTSEENINAKKRKVKEAAKKTAKWTKEKVDQATEFTKGLFNQDEEARFKLDDESETKTEEAPKTEAENRDIQRKVAERLKSIRAKAGQTYRGIKNNQAKEAKKQARSLWSKASSKVNDLTHVRYSHGTIVEQIHAQNKLRSLYPNSNLHVAVVDNLTALTGHTTLGMALHGVVYIDNKAWRKNNRAFFHEVAHINFALSKGEKSTQELIKDLVKNKNLIADLENKYWFQIQYQITGSEVDGLKVINAKPLTARDIVKAHMQETGEVINNRKEYEALVDKLISDGKIKKLPIEQQEVIVDELFATTLEYTYDNEFSNFLFERRTAEQLEDKLNPNKDKRGWLKKKFHKYSGVDRARRIGESLKKWMGWVKDNAVKKDPTEEILKGFHKTLKEKDLRRYSDLKQAVINEFMDGGSQRWTNPDARFKLLDDLENAEESERAEILQRIEENKVEIAERIRASNAKYIHGLDPNDNEEVSNESDENSENSADTIEEDTEHNEFSGDMYNIDRTKPLRKTSGVVKDFSKLYNKALRKKYFDNHKDGDRWNVPQFDGDQLLVDLYNLAADSTSDVDFVQQIENSHYEMSVFNDYLDTVHGDKYSYLSNFYMIAKDVAVVDAVQGYVNSDGKFELQSSMNLRENFEYDKAFDKVQKMYSANSIFTAKGANTFSLTKDQAQQLYGSYQVMNQAMKNIVSGEATHSDISTIASYFGATDDVINENILYMDGHKVPLDATVVGLVKRLGPNFFIKVANPNYDPKKPGSTKTMVNPSVIKFIRAAVVSNRKFTSDFTVQNAEGNQTPARIIKGHINRKFDKMNKDVNVLTKRQFINKYSRIKGNGVFQNNLLSFMWEQGQKGRPVTLSMFNGIKNDKTNKYSTYDNNNANDNSIMEFFTYVSTATKNGSYIMETGRYSDSPLSYMIEVPNNSIDKFGKFNPENGKFEFNKTDAAMFVHAVNTYNNFHSEKITPAEMKTIIEEGIQTEIDFLNENIESLKSNPAMSRFLSEDGKQLNSAGRKGAAGFLVNQFLNTMNFNQVFMPDISGKDFTKRAKGLRAPGYSLGENVKSEMIYFKDDLVNGNELDDSGMYILEDDAVRIQEAFGNVLKVGKGYKLLHTGMETENSNFEGNNFYDKGYTTIINEEYVNQNPSLRGLYETMKRRRQKYIDANGPIDQSLAGDKPTYIGLAVPMSANKIKNAQGKHILPKEFDTAKQLDENGNKTDKYSDESFSLGYYNDPSNFDAIDSMFDSMYYDQDSFMGLSGENLMLQQKMDKVRFDANFPIQTLKAITSEGSHHGNMKDLEQIQRLVAEVEQEQLQQVYDIVVNGTAEEVLNHFKENMISMDEINVLQKFLIEDGLSINTPAIRELAINTFLNHVRKNGNKLKTPGSIAQQKPSKHIKRAKLKDGSYTDYAIQTNGQMGLSFYKNRQNGSNKPGEAVAPSYLKSKLRARQYRLFSESENTQIIDYANRPHNSVYSIDGQERVFTVPDGALSYAKGVLKEAQTQGRISKDMSVIEFIESYKVVNVQSNTVVGFYIPGDSFMATRIPSHGVQSTGFFEVVDFDPTGASQIQLPFEFAQVITGGDYDGDQVFMQYKDDEANAKWNSAYDLMQRRWLSPEMNEEVRKPIDFEQDAKDGIATIEKNLGKKTNKKLLVGTPEYRRQSFNDTLVSKNNVGQAANYHSYVSMLSSYEIPFSTPITIDGKTVTRFNEEDRNRSINSAKILNLVLDNAKDAYADTLGINQETVGDAIILTQLGFDLGQIGTILNSKDYIDSNKTSAARRNTFAASVYDNDSQKTKADIVVNTKNLSREKSSDEVKALIQLMGDIKSDMSDISTLMGGHTRIESDPFILTEQIENIENLLSNKKANQVLDISKEFRDNPLVQNYLNTAKTALEIREKYDPVSRKDYKEIYGELVSSAKGFISKNQKRKLHQDFEKAALSRLVGWNNISQEYKKSLTDKNSPNNIFLRLASIEESMKWDYSKGSNLGNVVNKKDSSILFSRALSYNTEGNNKYVSLKTSFFSETMTDDERDLAIKEFNELPKDFRRDLLIYDMMSNGWKGPKSLFHLMNQDFTKEISKLSDEDIRTKDFDKLPQHVKEQLNVAVAEINQSLYPSYSLNPFYSKNFVLDNILSDSKLTNMPKDIRFNPWMYERKGVVDPNISGMLNNFRNGKPFSFFSYFKNGDGKYIKLYTQMKGLSPEEMVEFNEKNKGLNVYDDKKLFNALSFYLPTMIEKGKITVSQVSNDDKIGNEKLTSISDAKTNKDLKVFDKVNDNVSPMDTEQSAWVQNLLNSDPNTRYKLPDYYNYEETLNRDNFDRVMEFEKWVPESSRESAFKRYQQEKAKADKVALDFTEDKVKAMSTEVLVEHYDMYGNENSYAYAKVLSPIVKEIGERITKEQTEKYTQVEEDNKDISAVKKYMMANNIPSNHPMVQALVRNMETQHKIFAKEKGKYQTKLNDATNALYKEKFGYIMTGGSLKDRVKALWDYLFKNKESMYEDLYGNLITYDLVQKNKPDGTPYTMRVLKYKTNDQIKADHAAGKISDTELNFYETTKGIADDLGQYAKLENGKRADFIPHTAAGTMEAFSRRGLLGLMVGSKTIDGRIGDVRMDYKNPFTGEVMKNVRFSDIDTMFNIATSDGKTTAKAMDYYKLKLKAVKLLKKGKNEDGSDLKLSEIDMGTAFGDTFMDRFSNSGTVKSNMMPSLDLNKAFSDYLHTTLFVNGNENFAGYKKMLPLVDGALARLDSKGLKNMSSYVQKVWKDNFLKGAKQRSLKTPAHLEAFGVTSDKVIDFITKGSLVYWLGYKGLALGAGLYAVGNVLNGKFNNIAHAGGKQWAQGEKRFWLGKDGKFDLKNPFKGIREANAILKKAGFMDVNLSDDVGVTNQNTFDNFFMNMALFPMTYSERWIQGVHFLGMLDDEQWTRMSKGEEDVISPERMAEIENKIKLSHGKGFQATDQRMIQMYSWGRMMMQFSRHIPTTVYNNFAGKDKDNYGKTHIGAYRQVASTIQDVVTGKVSPKEFSKYYKGLDEEEQQKLKAGLMGFGILATAGALGTFGADNKYVNDLASDVNIFFDIDRLSYKLQGGPALGMIKQMID